ncbi:hypothetical protein A359_03920 [secondary endosymbiont of Ctenarytaina eucalypti]|uniref:Uncharacterized protein n=1 Tax=secondary endosymbiont of Ctenarytaina eucalypti TaxID=1199245 RepID=J3TXB0_9ENTR|nr:hypothetical protein A359_03920 [secondary endosymbiont of Ctenarytaina eucalypti]
MTSSTTLNAFASLNASSYNHSSNGRMHSLTLLVALGAFVEFFAPLTLLNPGKLLSQWQYYFIS